jgi:hypothetical protein
MSDNEVEQGGLTNAAETERRTHSDKIGLDANRPIDPSTGRIHPQVADPDVIASTGAGWVRLNFILGPWSGPTDETLHDGRTWAETYGQIVDGLRDRGLRLYGLVGCEAMPEDPGDRFRSPPVHGEVPDEWLDRYVDNFTAIVERFHQDVAVFESFNEPDDWQGQNRSWIEPGWFAIMLQRLHAAVRARPELQEVKLVSGPLQGLESNRNAAVYYLQSTYRAGKQWFGWGQAGRPFPFDGVGYHLYVREAYTPDEEQQARSIRTTYRRYLDAMQQLIRQEEGRNKPLYVSELGWNSCVEPVEKQRRETFQARSLGIGLEVVTYDPLVELGCCFCTQDFATEAGEMFFGLYRMGEPTPDRRKPAFYAFQAFCEEEMEEKPEEPQYTNQQIINAFYYAAVDLGRSSRWSLMAKAKLSLNKLAANRQGIYEGPPLSELPNLTDAERAAVQVHLDRQVPRATAMDLAFPPAEVREPDRFLMGERLAAEVEFDLTVALQQQILEGLDRNRALLEQVLARLAEGEDDEPGWVRLLTRLGFLVPDDSADRGGTG